MVQLYEAYVWEDPAQKSEIARVLAMFKSYCMPAVDVTYEKCVFNTRNQGEGETRTGYITEVVKLASTCDIKEERDARICERLFHGIRDHTLRQKVMDKAVDPPLTLDEVVTLLRRNEVTRFRAQAITTEEATLHVVEKEPRGKWCGGKKSEKWDKTPTTQASKSPGRQTTKPDYSSWGPKCTWCGLNHPPKRAERPAREQTCNKCNKKGHYDRVCRSKTADVHQVDDTVEYVELNTLTMPQGKRATAMYRLASGSHKVSFQIDTGASVKILPKSDYAKATADKTCARLEKTITVLRMHNNTEEKAAGVKLLITRHGHTYRVAFYVVQGAVTPLLCFNASVKLGLLKITDIDAVNVITTDEAKSKVKSDPILDQFADVFAPIGKDALPWKYKIHIDSSVTPTVAAQRKLPAAIREDVRAELKRMTNNGIIAPVSDPTSWVSSMVIIRKPSGKLRICLDPLDLNKAIQRPHYPLLTMDEVSTRLTNAKVFSVLDANTGFWQVLLVEESSFLTTFNTPFGRYR